jgi:sulfur carrier protein ThiS
LETILEFLHQIYGGETTLPDFLDGLELLVEPFLVDVQFEIVSPFFMIAHTEGKTVLIIINIEG